MNLERFFSRRGGRKAEPAVVAAASPGAAPPVDPVCLPQAAALGALRADRDPVAVFDETGATLAATEAWSGLAPELAAQGLISETSATPLLRLLLDPKRTILKPNGDRTVEIAVGQRLVEAKLAKLDIGAGGGATVVTLYDVTTARRIERELIGAFDAAAEGDLSHRVRSIDHLGFTSTAAERWNAHLEMAEGFMASLRASLEAVRAGDLSQPLEGVFAGDFAAAQTHYNASLCDLRGAVAGVEVAARDVREGAGPIAKWSGAVANRARAQATALTDAAQTMREISEAAAASAAAAERAQAMSAEACDLAETGGQAVSETVEAMDRIEASAERIGAIIGVIEGIAFQTNLLALNAAVEAARAGESGRGFAIVASEVRVLAQRSSDAARDVRDLIQTSSAHVENGVGRVRRTGESLKSLSGAIAKVANAIGDITDGVRRQSSGVAAVANGLRGFEAEARENAFEAEKSAAAVDGLYRAASELDGMLDVFKTAGQPSPRRVAVQGFGNSASVRPSA